MAAVAVRVSAVRDVVRRLVGMGGSAALLVATSSVVPVYRGEPPTSPPPSFDYLRSRRSRGTA